MAMESATNGESATIFKQLEEYQWDKDREFQGGLAAILGPNPQPSQVDDLTLRAQCFYLSRKLSIPIDFTSYKSYLLSKSQPATTSEPTTTASTSSDPNPNDDPSAIIPDWQLAYAGAPPPPPPSYNTPLPSTHATEEENINSVGAPYPKSFADIVELITSGKPIPGIKDIPEGVRPEQASIPVLPKRRKPWERDVPEAQIQGLIGGLFGDERDTYIPQELPDA
ncbi:uncharacterized protein PAC_03625 [Phialocephala subalpina]|uniref:Uncharacterized protein n=1 Tax=Phialocephala subalpina TaxID=576137 RepID=A0A1L7WLW0_9HELO|nr:uncharacterized protein PAC_03625 [Phialocephala subalpina]